MKAFFGHVLRPLLVLLVSASVAFAQTPPAPRNAAATQQELDQMLAPIALYPDSLLSQIFMAATYPLEVVEAARWSRANPALTGQQAVDAVGERDWDASVKSLAAFPQVLAMMDQHLEWTARLGDVFIAQEPQVMETVQSLRQKAYEAGNLRSTEQATVLQQGDAYAIEPASPEVVYVPYYDPRVAYGSWWWPAYPPVYCAPWPGYYVYPGFAFGWGTGVVVRSGFFFGGCDWRPRHGTVVNVTNVTNVTVHRQVVGTPPARPAAPPTRARSAGRKRAPISGPLCLARLSPLRRKCSLGLTGKVRRRSPARPCPQVMRRSHTALPTIKGSRETAMRRARERRTAKGVARAAPARPYFVASKAERTASMRLRLTPRSPRPTRDAERTWITFAAGSYQNSTSSTYFISLVVNCA